MGKDFFSLADFDSKRGNSCWGTSLHRGVDEIVQFSSRHKCKRRKVEVRQGRRSKKEINLDGIKRYNVFPVTSQEGIIISVWPILIIWRGGWSLNLCDFA